jgi:(2R)-ethylmalonyl-CoA mutase
LGGEELILKVDPAVQDHLIADVQAWRSNRDADAVKRSLDELRIVAQSSANIMPATIDLAHAGGTTGEWASVLREVFGEYRAPTGVAAAAGHAGSTNALRTVAERVKVMSGGPPRLLVAKPGLDGHSNGAEQIAVAARDAGMEVIYQGIRLTPEQIAAVARDEDVDVVGLSILSGSHLELVPEVVRLLRAEGVDAPVIVGGIIPEEDQPRLLANGVARVYTPKDFELGRIMADIADLVASRREP